MKFKLMGREQYRKLSTDELKARRDEVVEALAADELPEDITDEQLRAEADIVRDEFARREQLISLRNANLSAVLGGAGRVVETTGNNPSGNDDVDALDTPEYRKAFMDHCQRRIEIPANIVTRTDPDPGTIISGSTVTTGVPPQIPTTMQKEIISKMEEYGIIWNDVRKVYLKGGIEYRVLDLNPTATWLMDGEGKSELSTSAYQGVTNDETISFKFFMLECRMSMSLLAQAVTYDDFQALFVPAVAKAMVKALEQAIVRGNGSKKPLGLTVDPRITNVVSMTLAQMGDWKNWHSMVDAAIKAEYDNGKWYMSKTFWNKYIDTLADDDNAPIAHTYYDPVKGKRVTTLMGKQVELVGNDILPDPSAASCTNGTVFAFYGNLEDYLINVQPGMPMTTKRWTDEENNLEKIKSLMACDGKVLDPYGFMLLKVSKS